MSHQGGDELYIRTPLARAFSFFPFLLHAAFAQELPCLFSSLLPPGALAFALAVPLSSVLCRLPAVLHSAPFRPPPSAQRAMPLSLSRASHSVTVGSARPVPLHITNTLSFGRRQFNFSSMRHHRQLRNQHFSHTLLNCVIDISHSPSSFSPSILSSTGIIARRSPFDRRAPPVDQHFIHCVISNTLSLSALFLVE